MQQITAKIAEVLQVLIQERAHEHIDPSFFGSAVVGKRVKLALTLRKRCLKRRRHGHVESFQAVPQDVTMKVRQAEVYFPRHPGKLEELMQNEGLLWARLEVQAGLRFSACFSRAAFLLNGCDFLLLMAGSRWFSSVGTIEFAEEVL